MFVVKITFSIRIGFISNTTFIASINGQTYFNMTCTQCTCVALISSAVGWNCMNINSTCHLIKNYSLTDIGLIRSDNTTFFFQQFPIESLSTTVQQMTTETESITTMITTITTTATTIKTTSTTTSATSTTSTAYITTIASNPIIGSFNVSSLTTNVWTQQTYSYLSAISTNLTLKFVFETNKKDGWFLDDVSVRDPSSIELLINGDFESTPLVSGWTSGSVGSCGSTAGGAYTGCHSSSQCYYDSCDGVIIWISQSFAAIAGQVYSITFWIYYDYGGPGVVLILC